MRSWLPQYEGDGYVHRQNTRSADDRNLPLTDIASPHEPEHAARALRAVAIRALLAQFFGRVSSWLRNGPAVEAERYLSKASDLADLERRLVEAERRGLLWGRA